MRERITSANAVASRTGSTVTPRRLRTSTTTSPARDEVFAAAVEGGGTFVPGRPRPLQLIRSL
jgi:hypothetical protein